SFCAAAFFWHADFLVSAEQLYRSRPVIELMDAVESLPAADSGDAERVLTVAELEQTGKLSPATRAWLRNCEIGLRVETKRLRVETKRLRVETKQRVCRLQFPGGRTYSFNTAQRWLRP